MHILRHKRSKAGVKITDAEELDTDVTCSKYNSLPTPEVNKARAALKSSSLELRAVVKDPLPDALRDVAPNPSVSKSIEPTEIDDRTHENQSCSHQNNAPRPSLMARNSTFEVPLFIFCCTNLPVCARGMHGNGASSSFALSRNRSSVCIYHVVQKYGKGNWKLILHCYRDTFEERTEVDLKDKWRNMTRS
ncbi:uncharacterized protein LOC121239467 [Juglans microcarpa x Juglans regia]|uniref:uncharacterized protein LOC121239467 n=1 Tax=Juglans microcarpa x Juglans regia TaxID=2249226 RepID=UPI001B7E6A62|nr:uncharacterized protein LOC121239467 [Juglans microcarpa x Juglans regia]